MAAPTPRPRSLKLVTGRGAGRDSGGRVVPAAPGFARQAPARPKGMSRVASAKWDELVEELARLDLLSPVHGPALEMACEAYARWHRARGIRQRESVLATNSQGRVRHPAVAVEESAAKEYMAWCQRFGLTPSDESRVGSGDGDDGGESNPFAGGGS